jgi:hypothetical protein
MWQFAAATHDGDKTIDGCCIAVDSAERFDSDYGDGGDDLEVCFP